MSKFRPASQIKDGAGLFVGLTGGTNSGKTYSALTLARGIAGPGGKIAVLDTEGGRTLNLKDKFDFDILIMGPPFRPVEFSNAAREAEADGYACLVIDSFSMEWTGEGGVLSWADEEYERLGSRDAVKLASWIKPKGAHKAMVTSLLQRRIPIVFAIRGEESIKPVPGKAPEKIFKSLCSKDFPFELTVAFRLASDSKGFIDLSDPKSWKMEGSHQSIFHHGEQISEAHGAALARWSKSISAAVPARTALQAEGDDAAEHGLPVLQSYWTRLTKEERKAVGGAAQLELWKTAAAEADSREMDNEAADAQIGD